MGIGEEGRDGDGGGGDSGGADGACVGGGVSLLSSGSGVSGWLELPLHQCGSEGRWRRRLTHCPACSTVSAAWRWVMPARLTPSTCRDTAGSEWTLSVLSSIYTPAL